MIPIVARANIHNQREAVISEGKSYTYSELLSHSDNIANNLMYGKSDLEEERIPFLIRPSFDYVCTQWGIWRAGGIAVPLCTKHPLQEIRYVLEDVKAARIISDNHYAEFLTSLCEEMGIELIPLSSLAVNSDNEVLPDIQASRRAMILYTSGTTNKPKGVVSTHANITAQIETLVEAWAWEENDSILNVLPLHHVHGIINIQSCAMWVGASCSFISKFDAKVVFDLIREKPITLFMAVPTIYYKLIQYFDSIPKAEQAAFTDACKKFRLMVSGSAALPVSVLEKWKRISGLTLLERYGMTEIGMALSNPYNGERRPGHVGLPLPAVNVRLYNQEKGEITAEHIPGEIQVKSECIFKEYWKNPEATKEGFTFDGWFKTGDIAILSNGYYKILGRNSVDIIKSGGYKISALEIEEALLKNKYVNECAVVGIPDEEWGEIIVAAMVMNDSINDFAEISNGLKTELAPYKIPRKFLRLENLPRNTLGKVMKNELKKYF